MNTSYADRTNAELKERVRTGVEMIKGPEHQKKQQPDALLEPVQPNLARVDPGIQPRRGSIHRDCGAVDSGSRVTYSGSAKCFYSAYSL